MANVTLLTSGSGTTTITSNSLNQNQSATITVTPANGYKFDHATASTGTLIRNDINILTFTMPSPATDITIIVYFKAFSNKAKVGEIIYADWYNQ